MSNRDYGFNTRQVSSPDKKVINSHTVPVCLTSTYTFENVEEGAGAFSGENESCVYSRIGNPTSNVLIEKIALLEGAETGFAHNSGMAAISNVIYGTLNEGDELIASIPIYGGTKGLLSEMCVKHGIKVKYVDLSNLDNLDKNIDLRTKAIFIETPANPTLRLVDIEGVAERTKIEDIDLIVDNTFMSPYLQNPLELGADYVVHSTTKYINGHGTAIGGAVVGGEEKIEKLKPWYYLTGSTMGPMEAFLTLQGLRTLSFRMDRHCENAMEVADFLEDHGKISKVYYPGLKSFEQYELAKKQMKGFGGMVSFEMSDFESGKNLMNYLAKGDVIKLAVSLGCLDSLIEHPASMTHSKIHEEERLKEGITDGLVRLSVGCEDKEDIISELERCLDKI